MPGLYTNLGPSGGGAFLSLLFKWKGSLYKVLYKELIVFTAIFAIISAIYRNALNESQKSAFEQIIKYFSRYLNMIPLSFIMGFYVTTIVTRWWDQFMALPWPDRLILCITLYLPGSDEESRSIRWNLLRYANLMLLLVLHEVSESVRGKYPMLQDFVKAGFMTKEELETYSAVKSDVNLYWLPGTWFVNLLRQCGQQGRLDSDATKLVMEQFLLFKNKCATLWNYNWVSIPLVYTQVVTLATYTFFIACLFGRQVSEEEAKTSQQLPVDKYFPFWTILQYILYMGLLKVAEQMINPFGEDEEDFELNFLIQRHMKAVRLASQELSDSHPPLPGKEAKLTPERNQRTLLRSVSTLH